MILRTKSHPSRPQARSSEPDLEPMRSLAKLLDAAYTIPGTKIQVGLDAILGLVPGAGDAVTALLGLYVIHQAGQLGVPRRTRLRMLANLAIDLGAGTIPILGDLFDVAYKANLRNVKLVEKALARSKSAVGR